MGAVKNAMERDGADPEIMDFDPNKSVASQMRKVDDGPPLKDDPKYRYVTILHHMYFYVYQSYVLIRHALYLLSKYFKMLKMVSSQFFCDTNSSWLCIS